MNSFAVLLLDWSIKAAAVVLIAALVTRLLKSPSMRRAVWVGAFVLILVLPLLWMLPQREVPVVDYDSSSLSIAVQTPTSSVQVPILLLWLFGFTLCLVGWALCGFALRRARRRSRHLGRESKAELRQSTDPIPPVAITWGVFRPVILLPETAETWDDEHRRSVLLHELAHIENRDALVQWLGNVVCALLWFHPAIWLAKVALRNECEAAADEQVLAKGIRPSTYAETLIRTVCELRKRRLATHAALPFARKGQLERRVTRILATSRVGAVSPVLKLVLILVGLATIAVLSTFKAAAAEPIQRYSREFLEGYKAGMGYVSGRPPTDGDALKQLSNARFEPPSESARAKREAELKAIKARSRSR